MLESIRKRKDNFIYSILILAVVAVMAFYGVDKMNSDKDTRDGSPAAWVNGEMISQREFRQELGMRLEQYQSMLGAQYDEKFLAALRVPERTLEELVQMKLLAQQAARLGIVVPDNELAAFIQSLPYYQREGKFDRDTYLKNPYKGAEERRMRERLQLSRLQSFLMDRVRLTPTELEWAFKLRDTKLNLEYAKVDFNQIATSQKPSAKDVDAYLAGNNAAAIQAYYDSHAKDYTTGATLTLRQIRVGIPFKATDAQKGEARKKADAIAAEVTPENFAKVAAAKSDDEYAKKGGLVGTVTRGSLEEPLERAIDQLDAGKVSPVVETSFGYFILKADEKKAESVTAIDKVRRPIAEKLVAETQQKEIADTLRKRWDEMLASGKSIEPELKKYKVEIKKTGPFSAGHGYIPNVGQVDEILDGVFTLTKANPVGKALYPAKDGFYWVKLIDVEYPKAGTFAKEKDAVDRSTATALHSELMRQWLEQLQKQATVKSELDLNKGAPTEQM